MYLWWKLTFIGILVKVQLFKLYRGNCFTCLTTTSDNKFTSILRCMLLCFISFAYLSVWHSCKICQNTWEDWAVLWNRALDDLHFAQNIVYTFLCSFISKRWTVIVHFWLFFTVFLWTESEHLKLMFRGVIFCSILISYHVQQCFVISHCSSPQPWENGLLWSIYLLQLMSDPVVTVHGPVYWTLLTSAMTVDWGLHKHNPSSL